MRLNSNIIFSLNNTAMPPIRKPIKSKQKSGPSRSNRKARKARSGVFPKSISATKGRALINLGNKTPKTMDVMLTYKNMIRITQNEPNLPAGGGNLASGFPFRISLNSPCNPQGEILHVHTTGYGNMGSVTQSLTYRPNNLTGELAATGLTDKYKYFYVTKAIVDVVVMNQINQQGLQETFNNVDMTTTAGEGATTQATYLEVAEKSLHGELVNCAHITEDNSFNLNPITVASIRKDISGSVVKESLVFPNSRGQSNKFSYTYTPKKRFDIRDIRDNLDKLRFEADGSIPSPYESHFNCCVGKQLFPESVNLASALQTVDIKVRYYITAFERLSNVGSNDPVPVAHEGEL